MKMSPFYLKATKIEVCNFPASEDNEGNGRNDASGHQAVGAEDRHRVGEERMAPERSPAVEVAAVANRLALGAA
jgi:hypothetical protein